VLRLSWVDMTVMSSASDKVGDGISWKKVYILGDRSEPCGTLSLKGRFFDGIPLKL